MNKSDLICSLMAVSHGLENFRRARESWGQVGTTRRSFFTSSNGSNQAPKVDALPDSLEALVTNLSPKNFSFLHGNCRTVEEYAFLRSPMNEAEEERENEADDLSSIVSKTRKLRETERSGDWRTKMRVALKIWERQGFSPLRMRHVDGCDCYSGRGRVVASCFSWRRLW